MEGKLGITNLKPILALAIEMGNIGDQMGRTKGMGRYMLLTGIFDEAAALGSVDFKQVKQELKDLDPAETKELHDFLKFKFDIVDDKLELAIEEGVKILEEGYALVDRSIKLYKGLKAEA